MAGYGSDERVLRALESAVSAHAFLCGGRFSASDVYVGSQVGWGLRFGSLPESDALKAYWERVSARPAMARADAASAAEMPKDAKGG
jgi:glutathione S-transferase